MKDKGIISIMLLFAILAMLIFITPFIENKTSSYIWILYFIIIGVLAMIWIMTSISKNPKEIVEKFRKQHTLIQILDVAFIMVFIYGIITMNVVSITWILLALLVAIPLCQWFFKKEE